MVTVTVILGKQVLKSNKTQKILVSVKFVSAILGPEMGAPIFMDAWKMRVHKIPRFRAGGIFGHFLRVGR